MESLSDAEAIRASLDSPTSFAIVFDRHAVAVFRYARRRGGAQVAADVTAEVFTQAFGARNRFEDQAGTALPWLLGIATNLIRMHHRSERRRMSAYARHAVASPPAITDEDDVDGRIDARAATGLVAAALDDLPRRQREVLLLHTWADLAPAEIATALAIPAGTVRSDLSRARAAIRAHLAQIAPHLLPDQESVT